MPWNIELEYRRFEVAPWHNVFSYCGEITRLRKDCGELRQEVERLRTGGGQEVLQLQRVSVSRPYNAVQACCWDL